MSVFYDFRDFQKEVFKPITISVEYFVKDYNSWKTEFIQGVLKAVDLEKETITIEQHLPYINFLMKEETQTLTRTFTNGKFFMLECGSIKASK